MFCGVPLALLSGEKVGEYLWGSSAVLSAFLFFLMLM